MWIFRRTESTEIPAKTFYEVGFFEPMGQFWVSYRFKSLEEAESKVNYLNGG